MILNRPYCSKCGEKAIGTIEKSYSIAEFTWSEKDVVYSGNTEDYGDGSSETVMRKDLSLVICPNQHEWYTRIDDSPPDDDTHF